MTAKSLNDEPKPRVVLTYGPGRHRFDPTQFPWATTTRVTLIGAGGKGDDAMLILELFDADIAHAEVTDG